MERQENMKIPVMLLFEYLLESSGGASAEIMGGPQGRDVAD
jgi:hypothetical protein